jgi:hypothetical protein
LIRVEFIHQTAAAVTAASDARRCLATGKTGKRFEPTGAERCLLESVSGRPIALAIGVLGYSVRSAIADLR